MPERIGLEQNKTGIGDAHCEMRDVVNDKRKHYQPAHHHVTRSERGFDILPVDVSLRSRTAVFNRQSNGHANVNDDSREQEQTDYPKQRAEVAQMLRVTVDPIRSDKNLQIAQQMADNEKDQNDARDRDDHFFSNGRVIESGENIHDGFGAQGGTPHASDYERYLERQGRKPSYRFRGFDMAPRLSGTSNLSLRFTRGYNCQPHAEQRRASDRCPGNPWIQGRAFSLCQRARCHDDPPGWLVVAFSER